MRFVEFGAMEIVPDEDGKTIHCRKYTVKINPDLVCSISPIMIPGSLSGPDGHPVPVEGTRILFGATSVIVTMSTLGVEDALTGKINSENVHQSNGGVDEQ